MQVNFFKNVIKKVKFEWRLVSRIAESAIEIVYIFS